MDTHTHCIHRQRSFNFSRLFKLVSCLSRLIQSDFPPTHLDTHTHTQILHHVSKSRVSTRFAYTRYLSHLVSKFEAGWMALRGEVKEGGGEKERQRKRERSKVCDACAGFRQNPRETWDETAILKRANLPKVLISRRSLVRRSRRGGERKKKEKGV